ncbi:PTS sugar transporter subunit IIB [bacterium]|nr:PTS sugar transporter subunit IIB [bacterium]
MNLVLIRIDDRLIHGQIVEGWLKHIDVNCIMIVNDKISRDPMQKVLFKMVVPSYIKVEVFSFEEVAEKVKNKYFDKYNFLILVTSPHDVLRLIKVGLELDSVNVGGMHYSSGKKYILPSISIDEEDKNAFLKLEHLGVNLEVRLLPLDDRKNIMDYIK